MNTNPSRLAVTGKRFAAAGGQQGKDIPARERIADDFLLQWTERRETKILLQQREQFWRGGFQSRQIKTRKLEFKL